MGAEVQQNLQVTTLATPALQEYALDLMCCLRIAKLQLHGYIVASFIGGAAENRPAFSLSSKPTGWREKDYHCKRVWTPSTLHEDV